MIDRNCVEYVYAILIDTFGGIPHLPTCLECKHAIITDSSYRVRSKVCKNKNSPCHNRIVGPIDYCSHLELEDKYK